MSSGIKNYEHFAVNPINLDIQRSTFNRPTQHKTTFNAGKLVPVLVDEILPGDTYNIDISEIIRSTTPIVPVMDNAYIDTFVFWVPNRILWGHWEEFMGANPNSEWTQPVEYEIPQIKAPANGWNKGTIADYMGIKPGVTGFEVSHLPFRAYCKIWNDWFRDQNQQSNVFINTDETTLTGSNGNNYVTDAQLGGELLPVAKFHDYFTSALPEPQKGDPVLLPLGNSAPVATGDTIIDTTYGGTNLVMGYKNGTSWAYPSTPTFVGVEAGNGQINTNAGGAQFSAGTGLQPINLYADLSNATAANINQLRQAFAVQRLLEKDARGGTRYIEMIKAHFGVTSSDARMQRAEYLGGCRQPINMVQVLQTSSTDSESPQGNTAAYSLTGVTKNIATKSFEEHGYLMVLACIRTEQTYQDGIERMWNRKRRFDFYFPTFANLGEQAILNREIFIQNDSVIGDTGASENDEVFGYQEAWAEYRYKPSRVSGSMRSGAGSLDIWHYANSFSSLPTLSKEFIEETKNNIDRTLAVQSSVEDQFRADFYINIKSTRPMPLYSIPGLIDHH